MARTPVAMQSIGSDLANVDVVKSAANQADGNALTGCGAAPFVLVENGSGSPVTVTITSIACSHGRTETFAKTIAAGDTAILGPFSPDLWQQAGGVLYLDWSADTTITFAGFQS